MLFMPLLFGLDFLNLNTGYAKLNGVGWSQCHAESFSVINEGNWYSLFYLYCSHEGNLSKEFIDYNIRNSSSLLFDFLDSKGLVKKECGPIPKKLEIYELNMQTLNDSARFSGWQAASHNSDKIWGLYDPRNSETGVASIMLTNHESWNQTIFSHEIAHYWYDRLCIGNQYNNQVEEFALDFEQYYHLNR